MVSERQAHNVTGWIIALQGHPRSSILVPIESLCTYSYWWSIVTWRLSCTISEIRRLKCRIWTITTPILAKIWQFPLEYIGNVGSVERGKVILISHEIMFQEFQPTVWVKKSPPEIFWHFFQNVWEFLVQILHAYYTFLSTLDYKVLFNYLQLWRSYAILSATAIMCSKCPPLTETHAWWLHLIWHNFVRVGDNWIKICILAYVWTFNKRVNFGLKIPNRLGKMAVNASMRFGRWWPAILRTWCELGGHA